MATIETNNFKIFLGLLLGVDQIHDFTDEKRLAKKDLVNVLSDIYHAVATPAAAPNGGSLKTKMRGGVNKGDLPPKPSRIDSTDSVRTEATMVVGEGEGEGVGEGVGEGAHTDIKDTVKTMDVSAVSAEKERINRAQQYFRQFNANLK